MLLSHTLGKYKAVLCPYGNDETCSYAKTL